MGNDTAFVRWRQFLVRISTQAPQRILNVGIISPLHKAFRFAPRVVPHTI